MDKKDLRIAFIGDSLTEGIVGASYFDVLRQRLPRHELINHGKGGDTVISLYRRLQRIHWGRPVDLGFLWIGVNDVFVKTSWTFSVIKRLRKQPWSKDRKEFREYYRKILELMHQKIAYVYAVPPLLIGEDDDNPWNKELGALSQIIQEVSHSFPMTEFVNLRETIISRIPKRTIGPSARKSFVRRILDAVSITTTEEMERKASERGLHLTLDGVHLNTIGAEKVAEVFIQKIEDFSNRDHADRDKTKSLP
jgi:lysophospholipase L1-like esterase